MATIKLNYPNINKALPCGVPTDETLLIAQERGPDLDLYLCVKSGRNCGRVGTAHFAPSTRFLNEDFDFHRFILSV